MKGDSLFALIAGAAAGLTLGLLFAPEKGEETRRKMKVAAAEGWDEFMDAADEGWDKAKETVDDIKDEARLKILAQLDKLEKALSKDPDETEDEWNAEDA